MGKLIGIKNATETGSRIYEKVGDVFVLVRRWSRTYHVLGDDLEEKEPDLILNTPGLPQVDEEIEPGSWCRGHECKEADVVQKADGFPTILWEITARFDNKYEPGIGGSGGGGGGGGGDPTDQRARRRWYSVTEEVPMTVDVVGRPVETAAGEKINLKKHKVFTILEIVRFEYYPFDPAIIHDFVDHTNNAVFQGAPKGSALMLSIETDEEIIGEVFVKVTYKIKFNIVIDPTVNETAPHYIDDSWDHRIRHEGTMYIEAGGGPPVKAVDEKTGEPMIVRLNDDGTILPDIQPLEYLTFAANEYADFGALLLEGE